jgi:hypothetical protein
MCAAIVLVFGVYKGGMVYFMAVKGGAFIKRKLFFKTVNTEGENAVHIFEDVVQGVGCYYGNFAGGEGVFLNFEMVNGNAVGLRKACRKSEEAKNKQYFFH